jgi:hypothetical protein
MTKEAERSAAAAGPTDRMRKELATNAEIVEQTTPETPDRIPAAPRTLANYGYVMA